MLRSGSKRTLDPRLQVGARTALWFVAALTAVALTLSFRLDAWELRALRHPVTPEGVLRGEVARFLAVGYNDFGADLAWVGALLYYGGAISSWSSTPYLEHYANNVITLDPYFRRVYEWAGVVTIYKPTRITNEDVRTSIYFLKKGYERFPDDWEFPFMIGMNYYFELETDDAELAAAWKAEGTEYLREAALLPGAAHYVRLLSTTLLDRHMERKLAILHLREMLAQTDDPKARMDLELKLRTLEEADAVREIIRFDAVIRAARKKRLPFLDSSLYVLVDPPLAAGPAPSGLPTVAGMWRSVTAEPDASN